MMNKQKNKKSRDQLVAEIMALELEAGALERQAGGSIYQSNLFNQYLKISRKMAKLRSQL